MRGGVARDFLQLLAGIHQARGLRAFGGREGERGIQSRRRLLQTASTARRRASAGHGERDDNVARPSDAEAIGSDTQGDFCKHKR
jgi:hypothetical protein